MLTIVWLVHDMGSIHVQLSCTSVQEPATFGLSSREASPCCLPASLQFPQELRKVSNGINDRPTPLGGYDGVPCIQASKVHEANNSCGSSPMRTCQAVHHHALASFQRWRDELQHRLHEGDGIIIGAHSPSVAGYVKAVVADGRSRLVVIKRHRVSTIHDIRNMMLLQQR